MMEFEPYTSWEQELSFESYEAESEAEEAFQIYEQAQKEEQK